MDKLKLGTASQYVNNLLLSRGLLRDGKPVDFAGHQSSDAHALSAQTINVVHDLILRRDRDQEDYEALASSLKSLRQDRSRDLQEISRLKATNLSLRRDAVNTDASLRAAGAAARSMELSLRSMREENARAKATIAQVRNQCASDVRKRDAELSKLKLHLASRQRGSRQGRAATILVQPSAPQQTPTYAATQSLQTDVEDAEYSLRQESTVFLTQLSSDLSEENNAWNSLARSTLQSLQSLLTLSPAQHLETEGSLESHIGNIDESGGSILVQDLRASHDLLSKDLHGALTSLKELLTNPSFAPIEEVQSREDEIHRLREGWENMEARWNEAMLLMQSWKRRVMSGGETVNIEELRDGLKLGEGLDSPSSSRLQTNSKLNSKSLMQQTKDQLLPFVQDFELRDTMHEAEKMLPEQLKAKNSKGNLGKDFFPVEPRPAVVELSPSPQKRLELDANSFASVDIRVYEDDPDSDDADLKSMRGLTIAEKLILAEKEAHSVSNLPKSGTKGFADIEGNEADEENKVQSAAARPWVGGSRAGRKTGVSGVARRRKSTLSPQELEALLSG